MLEAEFVLLRPDDPGDEGLLRPGAPVYSPRDMLRGTVVSAPTKRAVHAPTEGDGNVHSIEDDWCLVLYEDGVSHFVGTSIFALLADEDHHAMGHLIHGVALGSEHDNQMLASHARDVRGAVLVVAGGVTSGLPAPSALNVATTRLRAAVSHVEAEMAVIRADDRFQAPTVPVSFNPRVALEQATLRAQFDALTRVRRVLLEGGAP